ncbi:RNA binding protein (contains ribosomal protein S1 domain) [Legionella gratiana]|uniref:RNA binding protein (Contains ribosomal protein S1 domain) n=1 Tax=Legionella gratiana TaxID=45066 RepID=A0A378JF83_9GAMM|nr:hypothetical protein [Legionella gratiana]KTD09135.1 RNA binding protein (contains ribosomal protein S1 domain) [Legionella gratiana]STX45651.1 RNA binding protein (contains ribosomal protein S1 domain) [Legionella gratiana]
MKILYIPFHEENDLVLSAINWKKRLSNENLLIIQHGQPIDYKVIENSGDTITIYVLAHGMDSSLEPFHLASKANITSTTTKLDIKEIAERFNSDFVCIHHKIVSIKLYFCNNQGNQKSIAERFNQNLTLFTSSIDYYAGTLFAPMNDKIKYSLFDGTWYKAAQVRTTLYPQIASMDSDVRLTVKERSLLKFLEDAKQKRFNTMIQRQHKARQERIMKNRAEYTEKCRLSMEEIPDKHSNHHSYYSG